MSAETNQSRPTASVNKSTMLIVFLTVFIDLLGFGIVLPLLPRYGAALNASSAELGLLMASFSAMQFLFAPFWGALSDRIGRRPILLLGLCGSACSYSLFGYVSSQGREFQWLGLGVLGWLYITRIGAGIAGATISTAQAVIADCTGPENRGRGMALIGAAFGIGFTFGPLIGAACVSDGVSIRMQPAQSEILNTWASRMDPINAEQFIEEMGGPDSLDTYGLRTIRTWLANPRQRDEVVRVLRAPLPGTPGYVAGALSALALILAFLKLQESRVPGSSTEPHRRFRMGIMIQHLQRKPLGIILGAIFVSTFGFAQFESTLSLLTERFGYGARSNFLLYAFVGLILTLGQGLLVRRLMPVIGERAMALTGIALMTTGFFLIGLTGMQVLPAQVLWLILPIVVIGFSAVTPSLNSLLSRAAGRDEQGAVLGSGQSLSSLARIFGPAIGSALLGRSTPLPYFLGAILILAGGAFITLIRQSQQSTQ